MNDTARWALHLDYYGALLTARQREALSLHIEEDLSFAEIAQELGITRQGAADAANAAKEQLLHYEEKLGLLKKASHDERIIAKALEEARDIGAHHIVALLEQLTQGEGDHGL